MDMAKVFEMGMLVCFGLSWPISVIKSIISKSSGGKSLLFTIVIIVGYVFGISSKILKGDTSVVLYLYFFNLIVVTLDLIVCIINKRREKYGSSHADKSKAVAVKHA